MSVTNIVIKSKWFTVILFVIAVIVPLILPVIVYGASPPVGTIDNIAVPVCKLPPVTLQLNVILGCIVILEQSILGKKQEVSIM